jgi:hypothetical protein
MEWRRFALVAFAAVAALRCSADNADLATLEKSRIAWRDLAAMHDDTYSYEVSTSSFTGYQTLTTLQFETGSATFRRFESAAPLATGLPGPLVVQWEERGTEVGSHTGSPPPDTIDTLYDRCARDVLAQDPNRNTIVLYLDEAGILKSCIYVPDNCADDCNMGVWLSHLTMGKTY